MSNALQMIFAAVEEVNANQKAELVAKNEKYLNRFIERNHEEAYQAYTKSSSLKQVKEKIFTSK